MAWIRIVLKMIPVIIKLMKVAEELFDDVPDSGPQKKALVMEGVSALIGGVVGVGGDPVLMAKIEKAVGWLIDAFCLFLFPHDDNSSSATGDGDISG